MQTERLKDLLWLACQSLGCQGGWIGTFEGKVIKVLVQIETEARVVFPYPQQNRVEFYDQGPLVNDLALQRKFPHCFQSQLYRDRELIGLFCGFSSIPFSTEHQRMIEVIGKQAETLLELENLTSDALARLASSVTHEINNPLFVMIENLRFIRRSTDNVDVLSSILVIEKTIERIKKITVGLKAYAKQKTGKSEQKTSIKVIIEDAISYSQTKLAEQQVELEFISPQEEICINCNPVQISQVILNLIHNAVDALKFQAAKKITISTRRDLYTLTILVSDNGTGVPVEALSQIFEPFFTTKDPSSGTGLGLSISKGLIEAHHGSIVVQNHVGAPGACFTIHLPLISIPDTASS